MYFRGCPQKQGASVMQYSFTYNKQKVIQGLRYHFIHRPEVRVMIILVNVFAIGSAVLFYMQKIRPEPFLLGSAIWLLLVVSFWFILPASIYKRAATFKDSFTIYFREDEVRLENPRGYVEWPWKRFSKFFESPNFFHLYFDAKSFFIVPKDDMTEDFRHELRGVLNRKIVKK